MNEEFKPIYNYSNQPEPYVPHMYEAHPYQKIGGWMLAVEVTVALHLLFAGLKVFGQVTQSASSSIIVLLSCVFAVLTVLPQICLLMQKTGFLRLYHITVIVRFVIIAVQIGSQLYAIFSDPARSTSTPFAMINGGALIANIVLPILIEFIICRLYFTRSVRVRTYMGTDAYITQCPFTRRIKPPQPAVPDSNP